MLLTLSPFAVPGASLRNSSSARSRLGALELLLARPDGPLHSCVCGSRAEPAADPAPQSNCLRGAAPARDGSSSCWEVCCVGDAAAASGADRLTELLAAEKEHAGRATPDGPLSSRGGRSRRPALSTVLTTMGATLSGPAGSCVARASPLAAPLELDGVSVSGRCVLADEMVEGEGVCGVLYPVPFWGDQPRIAAIDQARAFAHTRRFPLRARG